MWGDVGRRDWEAGTEAEIFPWGEQSRAVLIRGLLACSGFSCHSSLVLASSLLSRLEALVNGPESTRHMKRIRSPLQPPRGR